MFSATSARHPRGPLTLPRRYQKWIQNRRENFNGSWCAKCCKSVLKGVALQPMFWLPCPVEHIWKRQGLFNELSVSSTKRSISKCNQSLTCCFEANRQTHSLRLRAMWISHFWGHVVNRLASVATQIVSAFVQRLCVHILLRQPSREPP